MADQLILIEDDEGLNVVTTLDEARNQIALLRADNRYLRKTVLTYKEEVNKLYEALSIVKLAIGDGIDTILSGRRVK